MSSDWDRSYHQYRRYTGMPSARKSVRRRGQGQQSQLRRLTACGSYKSAFANPYLKTYSAQKTPGGAIVVSSLAMSLPTVIMRLIPALARTGVFGVVGSAFNKAYLRATLGVFGKAIDQAEKASDILDKIDFVKGRTRREAQNFESFVDMYYLSAESATDIHRSMHDIKFHINELTDAVYKVIDTVENQIILLEGLMGSRRREDADRIPDLKITIQQLINSELQPAIRDYIDVLTEVSDQFNELNRMDHKEFAEWVERNS